MQKYKLYKITFALIIYCSSCSDFVTVDPPTTQLLSSEVFSNDATATAAVLGIYGQMTNNFSSMFNGQMTLCTGLSADELINTSLTPDQEEFFANSIKDNNTKIQGDFWNSGYQIIYQANAVIEGLKETELVSDTVNNQLMAEALFTRAFSHVYLSGLFGNIPYVRSTDYRENISLPKILQEDVYSFAQIDLEKANELSTSWDYSNDRIRPNKATVNALMARVCLYSGKWAEAEKYSSRVISDLHYSLSTNIDDVFLLNSNETIWQMMPTISGLNTLEGYMFAQTEGFPSYASLSHELVMSFAPEDKRKNWIFSYQDSDITYYQPYKYRVKSGDELQEYYVVFRLAEQYLIRAEARAQQDNYGGAISDVDVIRARAGISLYSDTNPSMGKEQIMRAIEDERKLELFVEWGHRWFDLKRLSRADDVLSSIKENWETTDAFYPIPRDELLRNLNLLPQNLGY